MKYIQLSEPVFRDLMSAKSKLTDITVKVPRFEYARLIAAKAKLDMIEKMVNGMDSYAAYPVLKLLFSEEDADE